MCGDQALKVADEPDFVNASALVCTFLDFISTYGLSDHVCGFSSAQIQTLCLWVAYVAPMHVCEEMQLLFEELCSRCVWSDELQKYCYRSTGAALESEAQHVLTAVEVLRGSVSRKRLRQFVREKTVTRKARSYLVTRGEKRENVCESYENHLYFCRCEVFRAGRFLAMLLESECTGHQQLRLEVPSPGCDFRTPTTLLDLAVLLRAGVGGGNVVFGNDFFSAVVPGRTLSFRYELLRYLAVLEERVASVEQLPLEDDRVLLLMQASCSASSGVRPVGFSEDDLRASLQSCDCVEGATVMEAVWKDVNPSLYGLFYGASWTCTLLTVVVMGAWEEGVLTLILACFSRRFVPTDLPAVSFCIPWMRDGSGFYRTRIVCVPSWFSILTVCLDGLDPCIALRTHLSSPFLCLLLFSLFACRIVRLTSLLGKPPSARRFVRTVCGPRRGHV